MLHYWILVSAVHGKTKKLKSLKLKTQKKKLSVPKWHEEFQLIDGSYSLPNIQGYVDYIIKNMETLLSWSFNTWNHGITLKRKKIVKDKAS